MYNNSHHIDFSYCDTCKYKDTREEDDPCNECLTSPARNDGSRKPMKYFPEENRKKSKTSNDK